MRLKKNSRKDIASILVKVDISCMEITCVISAMNCGPLTHVYVELDVTCALIGQQYLQVYLGHVHNPEVPGHPVDHFVLLTAYDATADQYVVARPVENGFWVMALLSGMF